MKRNFLSLGIIILFIISTLTPIVISNTIKTSNEILSESTVDGGLMDSSWPMFQHDVRHTGRSPYGKSGNWFVEKWKLEIDSMMYSSPAIDKNGTIYIGSIDYHLYTINPNGTLKWRYKTGGSIQPSPAIAEDGAIYVGAQDGKLYAFYPNGTLKWKISIGGWSTSPVIDDSGIIYTSSTDCNIYAVYPNGTKKWNYKTGNNIYSSCVLDSEGTVYCGSHDNYMYAIYTNNGTLKWRYGAGTDCGGIGATVGNDGTIYFGDLNGYLHAVNPNGTQKWKKNVGANIVSSPSITEEGNIIIGSYNGYVYSLTTDNGAENWKFKIGDWIRPSPSIDKYGVIYIGALNGWFYAINPDGTLKWRYKTLDAVFSSAAIDENGTIYVGAHCDSQPDFYSYIYALEPMDNNAPDKPVIDGPTSGLINIEYNYTAVTSEPDGENISYYFDWGDGKKSGWTEFVPSGTIINRSHSWEKKGTYTITIKVKAKDDYGKQSEWSTFTIKMPRNKAISNMLFLRFLERYPLIQLLFLQLFGLQ